METSVGAGREPVSEPSGERLTTLGSGAIIGGLAWSGLEELGLWHALKTDQLVGPLMVMMALGALAALIPVLRRALWVCAAVIVLLLAVVSYTPVTAALTRPMVRGDPIPTGKLDGVVVLSGGSTGDSAMNPESVDRLLRGAQVARSGEAKALLISREHTKIGGYSVTDSADVANTLALFGTSVPVYYIDSATSTRDEAVRATRFAAQSHWNRIGIVTSPLHTRRACAVFEHAGFTVTCIPSESRKAPTRNLHTAEDRLRAFQGWFYEMAGTVNYRMKGWI